MTAAATGFEWGTAAPEELGFSPAGVEAMRAGLAEHGTEELFVARRDRVVCEWYAPEWHAARRHYTASLAKAIVGGASLAVAMGDGRVAPDDLACTYVPQWQDDPLRAKITVRHLATHTSGLSDTSHDADPNDPERAWEAHFWARDPDPFTISRDDAPVRFEPGTEYLYSNPGIAMLAYCVTAALRDAPQADIRTLLRDRVYAPIGLTEEDWSIGYGTAYEVDGMQMWGTWGGGGFTARAVARVGRLMTHHGEWEGRCLIDPAAVDQALRYAGMPKPNRERSPFSPASGLAWYTNEDGAWPDVPRDAFAGSGAQNQVLVAVPSLDLVAVRFGQILDTATGRTDTWAATHRHFIAPLMAALEDKTA